MDFEIPERVRGAVERARALVEREVVPLEPLLLAGRWDELEPALEAVRGRVREAGLWAPAAPAGHGGLGWPLLDFAHLAEALGRSPLGHHAFNCQAPDAGNVEVLAAHGSGEQQERWLAPTVAGEIHGCFAVTEPDRPGSNPTWLATRARHDGDGWVLDGRKWFTTAADGAAYVLAMAVTEPEEVPRHQRASLFVVPAGTPGLEHVRRIPVMGEEGRGAFSHSEIAFEGCRVPATALLGPRGAGFRIAQERLGPGRIHHAMRWIGIAERAFDLLVERAAGRELAPGEPLGRRGAAEAWIADSRAEIDAARLLVLRTAWALDRAAGDREAERALRSDVSALKFFVAGMLGRVLDRAIQAHGAAGLTAATPLAFWYAHERAARIYDGPDEVHRAVVARAALREHARRRDGER